MIKQMEELIMEKNYKDILIKKTIKEKTWQEMLKTRL